MIDKVKIIECPRDAMQSIKTFIPTKTKLSYLQSVVDVGFDVVDIGSFNSLILQLLLILLIYPIQTQNY